LAPRQHCVTASLARGSLVGDLLLLRGNRAAADDDRPSNALPHRRPATNRSLVHRNLIVDFTAFLIFLLDVFCCCCRVRSLLSGSGCCFSAASSSPASLAADSRGRFFGWKLDGHDNGQLKKDNDKYTL
jgi:hypothetical protein